MKAIFIDVDNTLLDFDEYVKTTMQDGFAEFAITHYEDWMYDRFHTINTGLWHQLELQEIDFSYITDNRWNLIFQDLGVESDGPKFEKYFRAQLNESAIPVDGAYELLEYLSGKYILCAASNGPFKQQVHRLEIADMAKYFDYIFISEDIGASKPAREFYDEALRRMNEEVEDCIMIGDSLTSDMQGGLNAGMKTCYYRRPGAKEAPAEVDYTVTDLMDICSIL